MKAKTTLKGLAFAALFFSSTLASAVAVDLELGLLVDVSTSISDSEFSLQKQGYVDAFKKSAVVDAIENGSIGSIAATLIYWSGSSSQSQAVGWTQISDATSAGDFADAIDATTRPFGGLTAVGSAIDFSAPLFNDNGFEGTRSLMDISGDGRTNNGLNTAAARDGALAGGIDTINGLVIGSSGAVLTFYEDDVIGGPGAFAIQVASFEDFGAAIRDKLVAEVQGNGTAPAPIPLPGAAWLMLSGLGDVGWL